MDILIITASPNPDGLTAACGEAARLGAAEAGAQASVVDLNKLHIGRCQTCGNGWGTCKEQHQCQVCDDFQAVHTAAKQAGALVVVTPVYWGEMSEAAKALMDRLRRCEAYGDQPNALFGKPVLCVAAAGGSGNGCLSCLTAMEKWVDHVKGVKFDFIGVTQRNRSYKLAAIGAAAKTLAGFKR